ncbi:glycosyltransferase [Sulfurisphaera ohwakuensis]|uniref:glycosyltransferase n=1 Tax=Sulfurisphaera ohwakuensis TaxID=69656 RepID=UPI0036F2433F
MKVLIVSFGDINNPINGYLMRVNYIYRCLSKVANVYLMQFVTDGSARKTDEAFYVKNSYLSYLITITRKALTLIPLIKSYDIVMIEGSMFLPFGIVAKALGKKVVYDTHGSIVELAKGLKGVKNFVFRLLIGGFLDRMTTIISDLIITVSEGDKEIFKRYTRRKEKVVVVRHAIDVSKIPFYEIENERVKSAIFVGNLNSVQNYEAVKKLIEIAKYLPSVRFLVVGDGKEKFPDYPENMVFMGKVSSLDEYYKTADVCVIPLTSGTGIKTKVLECMAYGRPVITTKKGVEGLINVERLNGVIVQDVEIFPEIIKNLRLDKEYKQLREYVEKNYSVEVLCKQLVEEIEKIFTE